MSLWKRAKAEQKKPYTTVNVAGAVMGLTTGSANTKVRGYIRSMERVDRPHEKYFIASYFTDGTLIKKCYELTEVGVMHMAERLRGKAGESLLTDYAKYMGVNK